MRRTETLRAFAILALLLPGLVLAAPTAGACGLCDRGAPCPAMAAPEPAPEAHSCCGDAAADVPATPSPASLSSKACDCGRNAPPAIVAAVEVPTTEAGNAEASDSAVVNSVKSVQNVGARCDRPSTTPPPPLLFLLDCVFLT